mmetsp:Transcript_7033/g.16374  ORF Transcript_7033/g.16374 Transcript_7033/m.16374 type:complete len:206 (-) Transcript_7033:137-754(-)
MLETPVRGPVAEGWTEAHHHEGLVRPHQHGRKGCVQICHQGGAAGAGGGAGERGRQARGRRLAALASGEHPHHGGRRSAIRHPHGQGASQLGRVRQHLRGLHPARARRGRAVREGQEGRHCGDGWVRSRAQLGGGGDQVGMRDRDQDSAHRSWPALTRVRLEPTRGWESMARGWSSAAALRGSIEVESAESRPGVSGSEGWRHRP